MLRNMTEWAWQGGLTAQWSAESFLLGHRSVRLISWEVMTPSWKTNHGAETFGEPAVDFLGLSDRGELVAIELKPVLSGGIAAATAAAQTLAGALAIAGTATTERLSQAYAAARAGAAERACLDAPSSLTEHFARHCGRSVADVLAAPVVAVLIAKRVGPDVPRCYTLESIRAGVGTSRDRRVRAMEARLDRALTLYPSDDVSRVEVVNATANMSAGGVGERGDIDAHLGD